MPTKTNFDNPKSDLILRVAAPEHTMFGDERAASSRPEALLVRRLNRHYTPQLVRQILVPLIDQTSPVSLRTLDWAVVNWSKKHSILCSSRTPGDVTNIHASYRATLALWRRRLFDPFRRRERILVRVDDRVVSTTLGQANFVLWTYQTGILSYVVSHAADIESDMNAVTQEQKRRRRQCRPNGAPREQLIKNAEARGMAYAAPKNVAM
jgi:hypothetical protein